MRAARGMAEELCHLPDVEGLGVRELRVRAHVERDRVDHNQTRAPAGAAWRIVRVPLCPCDASETRRPSSPPIAHGVGPIVTDRMTNSINAGFAALRQIFAALRSPRDGDSNGTIAVP